MRFRLIRSATLRLRYAGRELLVDPYFAPRHSRPSFTGRSPNPLIELPVTPGEVMAGVELVIVSHLHSDHFDPEAQRLVPKDLPILSTHLDSLDHGTVSRADLRAHARSAGIPDGRLWIPEDGESREIR
jgi:L-ascorbate metabolism protein UlaG (beta-lactamase superfamily)